jgi:hypothetical protein
VRLSTVTRATMPSAARRTPMPGLGASSIDQLGLP